MKDKLKPIETPYKGYRFRSRTEARWAVFLDSIGEEWEYETEGYPLKSGCYLPDFYLPRLGYWLEVKPNEPIDPNSEEVLKCQELARATEKPVVMVWGLPANKAGNLMLLVPARFGVVGYVSGQNGFEGEWRLDHEGRLCLGNEDSGDKPLPQKHFDAARGARFETFKPDPVQLLSQLADACEEIYPPLPPAFLHAKEPERVWVTEEEIAEVVREIEADDR